MIHGASGYAKHKCRCDICREGNRVNKKAWRDKNREADYPQHRRTRQWPLQPLLDEVPGARKMIGVEWTSWNRAMENGLADRTADHWAIKCGVHPGDVWPDWFDRGLEPLDDVFVNGTETAVPGWRTAYEYEEAV